MSEKVNHPRHYGGKDDPYEARKVIEAWKLGFNLGNTLKYIKRDGTKEGTTRLEDLRKAEQYLQFEIEKEWVKQNHMGAVAQAELQGVSLPADGVMRAVDVKPLMPKGWQHVPHPDTPSQGIIFRSGAAAPPKESFLTHAELDNIQLKKQLELVSAKLAEERLVRNITGKAHLRRPPKIKTHTAKPKTRRKTARAK